MNKIEMIASSKIRQSGERGYILLTLLLFVAVLAITAAVVVPEITFQVKRDREEEMIHRGVQYSRAIRKYVRKFGRYPTRIEELENTSNYRSLRKRYKDPITGKDFKLLHLGEVQLTSPAGIPGATPAGSLGNTPINTPRGSIQPNNPASPDANQTQPGNQDTSSSDDKLSGQVFGGGPIVGVASTSKAESIREFNHKNHYNQWQFIYDQATDRGGLINTPAQPPLQGSVPMQGTTPNPPPPTEAAPQTPPPPSSPQQ